MPPAIRAAADPYRKIGVDLEFEKDMDRVPGGVKFVRALTNSLDEKRKLIRARVAESSSHQDSPRLLTKISTFYSS